MPQREDDCAILRAARGGRSNERLLVPRFEWTKRSLSFWVALGMTLTVLPLIVSGLVVGVWLHGRVVGAFDDVASRGRYELRPLHQQQVAMWEAAVPVEEFLSSHDPGQPAAYRELRVQIEQRFQELDRVFAREERLHRTVQRAVDDWSAADRIAGEIVAHTGPADAATIALADRFNGLIGAAVDKLRAVEAEVSRAIDADHDAAFAADALAQRASLVAAIVSALLIVAGVLVIRRVMLANVARLVDGARRFAAGEHGHRIAVQVPPELREVADELNRMIERIHDAEELLVAEAHHDPLTGLDNRRSFEEAMAAALGRLRRLNESFVLLMLDVDHFKKVNDTHGHGVGDQVLASVAKTLSSSVREVDRVFRIGGEEFAAILTDVQLAGAELVAERIRRAVESSAVQAGGVEVQVTVSIGLAPAEASATAETLLRSSDAALYAAKSAGRNRVVLRA